MKKCQAASKNIDIYIIMVRIFFCIWLWICNEALQTMVRIFLDMAMKPCKLLPNFSFKISRALLASRKTNNSGGLC